MLSSNDSEGQLSVIEVPPCYQWSLLTLLHCELYRFSVQYVVQITLPPPSFRLTGASLFSIRPDSTSVSTGVSWCCLLPG